MSIFDKVKTTIDNMNLSEYNMENLNNKARNKILNENFLPMLKNNGFDLTYEEVETLQIPLGMLMMPNALTKAFNETKLDFCSNENAIKANKILTQLTPILRKIDNINERYNGKPPAKYFRMDTYISNEEMLEMGLTNDERNYYVSILFNSKTTTDDIPKNLRPYIYTKKEQHCLVLKRKIPEKFKKEAELFYLKFYTLGTKDYPKIKEFNNSIENLEDELNNEMLNLLNE